jgi:drug/metabolite transporter (DMT)-like permease
VAKQQENLTNQSSYTNTGWGIFWASVSVLCWATLFPAVSFLLARNAIDCYSMAMARFFIGGLSMLVSIWVVKKQVPTKNIKLLDFIAIASNSLFAASMSVLLFYGQSLGIPLVNAALLESEAPLVIFILSIFILRCKVSILQCLGLLVGFIGSMLVLKIISIKGFMISSFSFGDLMVFLAALCWALYTVLANKVIKKLGGLVYTAWSLLFAGLGILLFQVTFNLPVTLPKNTLDIFTLLYLAIIPTAVAFFSWNNAQKYITPGLLAISGYFTPMLTSLLGWLFFNQSISLVQLLGMVLVINSALIEPEISKFVQEYWKSKLVKK